MGEVLILSQDVSENFGTLRTKVEVLQAKFPSHAVDQAVFPELQELVFSLRYGEVQALGLVQSRQLSLSQSSDFFQVVDGAFLKQQRRFLSLGTATLRSSLDLASALEESSWLRGDRGHGHVPMEQAIGSLLQVVAHSL